MRCCLLPFICYNKIQWSRDNSLQALAVGYCLLNAHPLDVTRLSKTKQVEKRDMVHHLYINSLSTVNQIMTVRIWGPIRNAIGVGRVQNFINIYQKMWIVGWTQEKTIDRRTDELRFWFRKWLWTDPCNKR